MPVPKIHDFLRQYAWQKIGSTANGVTDKRKKAELAEAKQKAKKASIVTDAALATTEAEKEEEKLPLELPWIEGQIEASV